MRGLIPFCICAAAATVRAARAPVPDPCAVIAGKKWVSPFEARTCLYSAPLDERVKANTIEVINKTLAFHTSTNYQVQAPKPFDQDVHEDLLADLAKFNNTEYTSEFAFHLDIYRAFKRVNDGHCWVYNYCYDSLYISYLPIPLVLLTDPVTGEQDVHIAHEAYEVASAEFGEEVLFWEGWLAAQQLSLRELSGAKVVLIDWQPPFQVVDKNALVTGGYQGFGTRQNAFFSSYQLTDSGWTYSLGNFATLPHPLVDEVQLVVLPVNSTNIRSFTLPYRSRFGSGSKNFTDYQSWRSNNCQATRATNGINIYDTDFSIQTGYKQHPLINYERAKKQRPQPMNILVDSLPPSDVELPEYLQPTLPTLNESYSVAQFYVLNSTQNANLTGVLALGSFAARNFTHFQISLLDGLTELKSRGVTKLIVDVTNNGGGYICIAHWLHRIIIGPSPNTEPQAGLDTKIRAGPLARLIVKRIAEGSDPDELLSYNPVQWRNATNHQFPTKTDWMTDDLVVKEVINSREDVFSKRLGQECQPFDISPPDEPLFEPNNVVIISNGRCGSSCSLFSITMAKKEGIRTAVVGGRKDIAGQYCGVVGGQSTNFVMIDTEVKSTGLKNHSLAPPDFIGNVAQGITWRLGFGIDDPLEPEEWQDHPADINLPLTADIVNKPDAIWERVAETVFDVKQL